MEPRKTFKKRVKYFSMALILLIGSAFPGWSQIVSGQNGDFKKGDIILTPVIDDLFGGEVSTPDIIVRLEECKHSFEKMDDGATKYYWLAEVDFYLGIANLGTGKKGDAENHFANSQKLVNQSLQIKESSQGYRLLADTYMKLMPVKGFFYSAANGGRLKSLPQKAIKRNPQNYKAHISLALFYIHAPAFGGGSIAKGIEMLLVALKSAEKVDRFNAYMWLGIVYQKEKNYQEAMLYLNKALAIYPNNGWAKQTLEAVAAQSN